MKSAREHVVEIITIFYSTTQNLKIIQNKYFNKNDLNILDRNRAVVLNKEIIRWKGRLDWYIRNNLNSPFSKLQPKLLAIMELASYELLFDEQVPNYAAINSAVELAKKMFNKSTSGLVNAVLRKISQIESKSKPNRMPDNDWNSVPQWLHQRWIQQFGDAKTTQLCNYFNSFIPLTIRRNSIKVSHNNFMELFTDTDIRLSHIKGSERYYNVDVGGGELANSQYFQDGYFSFQDRGAGAIVEVLDAHLNETILDVCCAPGTKTNYIAELMQNSGKIYASDNDPERVDLAINDGQRLKNINIVWEQKDATADSFPMADRVLIDAPCTGTGVIGRRPDIKWRRNPKHIDDITYLQKAIINNACKYVKPDGILVYATCSLEDEENWQVVDAFLKLHDDFKVISIKNPQLLDLIDNKGALKIFPSDDKIDGMFAVKMLRTR